MNIRFNTVVNSLTLTGTFDDGLGAANYANNARCQYKISVSGGASRIDANLVNLDSERYWDFLCGLLIKDPYTDPLPNYPSVRPGVNDVTTCRSGQVQWSGTSSSGIIIFTFKSDNGGNRPGFTINYVVTPVDTCVACPAGSVSQAGTAAVIEDCCCDVGYTGPNGGICTACGEGTYTPFLGSGECVFKPLTCGGCRPGLFLSEAACVLCPEHSTTFAYTNATAATDCFCDPGYTSMVRDQSLNQCSSCEIGYFKTASGNETALSSEHQHDGKRLSHTRFVSLKCQIFPL